MRVFDSREYRDQVRHQRLKLFLCDFFQERTVAENCGSEPEYLKYCGSERKPGIYWCLW